MNETSGSGATALMYAAMDKEPRLVDLRLEHGADATLTDEQGQTAADGAEGQGPETLAKRLEEGATDKHTT